MRKEAEPQFGCVACGSPSVVAPSELYDSALVHCASCGACLGTWASFQAQALRVIRETIPKDQQGFISPDPIRPEVG
jgi:transcription elongation factor Elf1